MTRGDQIYVRTISAGAIASRSPGNNRTWQHHSRSDAHSKAVCWGIVFDLLESCPLMREHALGGKIGFGINHEMRDFRMNRKKNLDLVICSPHDLPQTGSPTFADLDAKYGIVLDDSEAAILKKLPDLKRASVGGVLVALEAKACMTEHTKACPRLYDELSSSFQTILGDTQSAIAAAFVTINAAETFVSPVRNKDVALGADLELSLHNQPKDAKRVLEKVKELPRRRGEDDLGYDALGTVFVDCRNDGSTISIVESLSDGTPVDPILSYQSMISRISSIYTSRFRAL